MILNSIADALCVALPELVQGKSLFIERLPAQVTEGVLLLQNAKGIAIDGEVLGLRQGTIQVVIRSAKYGVGSALADRCTGALTFVQRQTLGDYEVKSLRPLHEPVSYPITEGQNTEFSVNFAIIYAIVNK